MEGCGFETVLFMYILHKISMCFIWEVSVVQEMGVRLTIPTMERYFDIKYPLWSSLEAQHLPTLGKNTLNIQQVPMEIVVPEKELISCQTLLPVLDTSIQKEMGEIHSGEFG